MCVIPIECDFDHRALDSLRQDDNVHYSLEKAYQDLYSELSLSTSPVEIPDTTHFLASMFKLHKQVI